MPDLCDIADETCALDLALALRNKRPELPFTGQCLNCQLPVGRGHWCDPDCREDWEKRQYQARMARQ